MTLRKSLYLTAAALLALLGCGEKIEPGNTREGADKAVKAPVEAARVIQQPFLYEAVGTVEARVASTISGKLMGTVKAVHVREGDRVKTGDILVEIDKRQVAAQLRQAEAALNAAKRGAASAASALDAARAGAELSRTTYQRYLKLVKQQSVSKQEFDEVEARHRQAEASLSQARAMMEAANFKIQQAEAAVSAARVGKKDAAVRAPYDGRVTAKMVDVGDLAAPGTSFLTLEKEGVYCVALVLPERHIRSIRLNATVKVTIPSLDDRTLTGVVGRINPSADQKSRTFRVKVALPEDKDLRSGMFARVSVPVGEAGMILIPTTAVVQEGQLTGIFWVDPGQTARFRLIRIGQTFGDRVEVISGLKEGDRYVAVPPPHMEDGVKVEAVL